MFPIAPMRLLIVVLAFAATPAGAWACFWCGLDQIRLGFPFLYVGLAVLLPWRILYGVWRRKSGWQHRNPLVPLRWRVGGLLVLMFTGLWGGLFLFFLVSFAIALFLDLPLDLARNRQASGAQKAVPVFLHALVLVILTPVAVHAYVQKSRLDDLDKLVRYVHSGTAPGRALARRIGRDPSFDPERLRPLLTSDESRATKGYVVLLFRANPDDVHRFADVLLTLEDADFDLFRTRFTWLTLWLREVTNDSVHNKAELRQWLAGTSATAAPEQASSLP